MTFNSGIFTPIETKGEVNHHVLVEKFFKKHKCVKVDNKYFVYDKTKGIWCFHTADELVDRIAKYCNKLYPDSWESRYRKKVLEEVRIKIDDQREFLDTDNLICLSNGVLCIETGVLMEHSPDYFFTSALGYAYDPNMDCPNFDKFLNDICKNNELRKNAITEFMGYCLTYDIKNQQYAYFFGDGNNGKSTLIRLIEELVGEDFCTTLEVSELSDKFSKVDILGKKVITFADISPTDAKKVVSAVVKKLTSGDKISTDVKFQERVKFKPRAKLIFSSNHELSFLEDSTLGAQRRAEIIPFLRKIPKKKVDVDLEKKLIAELPGIIEIARLGYLRLKTNKYKFSNHAESEKILNRILAKEKPESSFVNKKLKKSENNILLNSEIKQALKEWCEQNNIKYENINYTKITSLMQEKYSAIPYKGTKGVRGWKNVILK